MMKYLSNESWEALFYIYTPMQMNYEEILKRANSLLATWSVEDIDDFLPELMDAWDVLDLEAKRIKLRYDEAKDDKYLTLKKSKNDGSIKSSDKDIEIIARSQARKEVGDPGVNETIVRHFYKYIEMLNSKKISLMSIDKQKRELMWE